MTNKYYTCEKCGNKISDVTVHMGCKFCNKKKKYLVGVKFIEVKYITVEANFKNEVIDIVRDKILSEGYDEFTPSSSPDEFYEEISTIQEVEND